MTVCLQVDDGDPPFPRPGMSSLSSPSDTLLLQLDTGGLDVTRPPHRWSGITQKLTSTKLMNFMKNTLIMMIL